MNLVGSYSLLNAFESCNKKAFHMYVAKDLPYAETPAIRDGNEAHAALEGSLKGKPLDHKFEMYAPMVQALLYQPASARGAEEKLAIRQDGSPCDFFDPAVWFRGKVDAYAISGTAAAIVDWKTGKIREDPDELELFAVMLKARHPELERITGHYVWLKDMKVGLKHDLSGVKSKRAELDIRMAKLLAAKEANYWPAQQGPLCPWCKIKSCQFYMGEKING